MGLQLDSHPVAQALEPAHLVLKLVAARFLAIRKIAANNPDARHIGADHTRHVVCKAGDVTHHVQHRFTG